MLSIKTVTWISFLNIDFLTDIDLLKELIKLRN